MIYIVVCVCLYVYEYALLERWVFVLCCVSCFSLFLLSVYIRNVMLFHTLPCCGVVTTYIVESVDADRHLYFQSVRCANRKNTSFQGTIIYNVHRSNSRLTPLFRYVYRSTQPTRKIQTVIFHTMVIFRL